MLISSRAGNPYTNLHMHVCVLCAAAETVAAQLLLVYWFIVFTDWVERDSSTSAELLCPNWFKLRHKTQGVYVVGHHVKIIMYALVGNKNSCKLTFSGPKQKRSKQAN